MMTQIWVLLLRQLEVGTGWGQQGAAWQPVLQARTGVVTVQGVGVFARLRIS